MGAGALFLRSRPLRCLDNPAQFRPKAANYIDVLVTGATIRANLLIRILGANGVVLLSVWSDCPAQQDWAVSV